MLLFMFPCKEPLKKDHTFFNTTYIWFFRWSQHKGSPSPPALTHTQNIINLQPRCTLLEPLVKNNLSPQTIFCKIFSYMFQCKRRPWPRTILSSDCFCRIWGMVFTEGFHCTKVKLKFRLVYIFPADPTFSLQPRTFFLTNKKKTKKQTKKVS